MRQILFLLVLCGLAAGAAPVSAQPAVLPADSVGAGPDPVARFYGEPFARPTAALDPGPRRSYPGLFLFTGSTAMANALVVAGGAHADALAGAGLFLGALSLVASLDSRTAARPAHFLLGVTTIAVSLMNIANPPDTYGPGEVQSAASYKGTPLGFSLSF
jgi:hypothetical protein